MTIEELILEMQKVKQEYPTLEIQDVLRLFNIQAMKDLTTQIKRIGK